MTLCPSHGLPHDRRRAWSPSGDAFLCAACESLLLARRASRPFPYIPPSRPAEEALQALVTLFSDPRCG